MKRHLHCLRMLLFLLDLVHTPDMHLLFLQHIVVPGGQGRDDHIYGSDVDALLHSLLDGNDIEGVGLDLEGCSL